MKLDYRSDPDPPKYPFEMILGAACGSIVFLLLICFLIVIAGRIFFG